MVNTFILSTDFKKSAKFLDRQRLGKQRVEAKQVLDICKKLKRWSQYYNLPLNNWTPNSKELLKSQINVIRLTVKKDISNHMIHFYDSLNDEWKIISDKPNIKVPCSKKWSATKNGQIKVGKNLYNRENVKLPNDIIGTLGFVSHPVVIMWIGFENELSYYINCHIEEWISRGYINNMDTLFYSDNLVYPGWINKSSIQLHKAMMVQKELQRSECIFSVSTKNTYINMTKFMCNYHQEILKQENEIIDWVWY